MSAERLQPGNIHPRNQLVGCCGSHEGRVAQPAIAYAQHYTLSSLTMHSPHPRHCPHQARLVHHVVPILNNQQSVQHCETSMKISALRNIQMSK